MDKLVEYAGRKRGARAYSSNLYRKARSPYYRGNYGLGYRPRRYSPRPIPNGYLADTEYSRQDRNKPSQAHSELSHVSESAAKETFRPEKDAEELLKELEADPKNQRLLELVLEKMDKEFEELRQQLEREAIERGEQLRDNDPPPESVEQLSETATKQLVESAVADAIRDHEAEAPTSQLPDVSQRVDASQRENGQTELSTDTHAENSELENLTQELDRIDLLEGLLENEDKIEPAKKKGLEVETEEDSLEVVEASTPPEAQPY